jgi:SAM-dependent methyltransferase
VTQANFAVPDEAVKFILLQRTGLQKFNFRIFRKLGVPYYPHFCLWESKLRRDSVVPDFTQSIMLDYEEIRAHLPAQASQILDIGCGVAGIDVALNQHYTSQPPRFYLLDRSTVSSKVFYDFHAEAAYYNSLDAARAMLVNNGVAPPNVVCLEATEKNEIAGPVGIDLVISLISWGFHYPVSVYLPEVARVLSPHGSIILDVRKDSPGLDDLRGRFGQVAIISEKPKFLRVLARR